MITVTNYHFIAEGTPGNLGGRGRNEAGGDAYLAEWRIWGIGGWEDDEPFKDDLFAEGHVKWDGCSNWSFKNDRCMYHACSRETLLAIGDILAKCWDASADLMPRTFIGKRVTQPKAAAPIIILE